MTAGLCHYEAVTAIYAIQAGMVGLAYLLRWQSDPLILSLYLILAGAVLALFLAACHGLLLNQAPQLVRVRSERWLVDTLSVPRMSDLPIRFLAVVVPLFLMGTLLFPGQVPPDVGYLSTVLFAIVLIGLLFIPRFAPYFVRGGLYMGSTFLFYVTDASWMQKVPLIGATYHILFVAIALMVGCCAESNAKFVPQVFIRLSDTSVLPPIREQAQSCAFGARNEMRKHFVVWLRSA